MGNQESTAKQGMGTRATVFSKRHIIVGFLFLLLALLAVGYVGPYRSSVQRSALNKAIEKSAAGNCEAAIPELQNLTKAGTLNKSVRADAYLRLGECQIAVGSYDDAAANLDTAMKMFDDLKKLENAASARILFDRATVERQNRQPRPDALPQATPPEGMPY